MIKKVFRRKGVEGKKAVWRRAIKKFFGAKVRKKGANRLKIGVYEQKMCENIETTDHSYNQIVKQ